MHQNLNQHSISPFLPPRLDPHFSASLELEVGVRWLGLQVRAHRETGPNEAEVEFVARSRPHGGSAAYRLHETSRFVREDGRWYYVDGVIR